MIKLFRAIGIVLLLCLVSIGLQQTVSAAAPSQEVDPSAPTVLNVAVIHDPPYLIKGRSGEWTGLNVDIWKAVSRELKIDYTFKEMTFEEILKALKAGR